MSDIFEEVEENIQKERAEKLWRRIAPWVFGLVTAAILAVAAYEFQQWRAEEKLNEGSVALDEAWAAFEAGDLAGAREKLAIAEASGGPGYAALAAQFESEIALGVGEGPRSAATILLESAEVAETEVLADLARIKAAWLLLDLAPRAEIADIVEPLRARGGVAGLLARDVLAAKAFAEGDEAGAHAEWSFLRFAPDAPAGVRQRAEIGLEALGPRAAPDDEPAPDSPVVDDEGGAADAP